MENVIMLFMLAHLFLSIFAFGVLFYQSKPRETNIGWAIAIFYLPILGSLSFIFLRIIFISRQRAFEDVYKYGEENETDSRARTRDRHALLGYNLGFPGFVGFDEGFEVLLDDAFLDSLLEDVAKAKESIFILTYIFSGKVAEKTLDALEEAENRGVKVCLVTDWMGSQLYNFTDPLVRRLSRLSFVHPYTRYRFTTINQRLHTKLAYIDGTAWIGSHNIRDAILVNKYANDGNTGRAKNVTIRFSGALARQCLDYIRRILYYSHNLKEPFPVLPAGKTESAQPDKKNQGRILFSGLTPFPRSLESMYVDLILNARHRCIIINPYFAPSQTFLEAIKIAINRNVRFEIITPLKLDNIFTPLTELYLSYVNKMGATIYRNPGVFDHSKIMIIDNDTVVTGSFNTDLRSSLINLELVCEFRAKDVVRKFLDIHEQKKKDSVLWEVSKLPMPYRAYANIQSFAVSLF